MTFKYFLWRTAHEVKFLMERFKCKNSKPCHLGNLNPGKKIYIVKRTEANVGLMSYVNTHLGKMSYALSRGCLPVVDMQNYRNSYLSNEKIGIENSWEYYFEQPLGISLQDAYQSECVFFSTEGINSWPNDKIEFYRNRQIRKYWFDLAQKYLRVKTEISRNVDEIWRAFNFSSKKVLAVKCRGTDYTALHPKGHPVQPELGLVMQKCHELIDNGIFDVIFLATEDIDYVEKFKDEFSGKVFMNQQTRCRYSGKGYISEEETGRENDKYYQGLEYLITLLLIAKCDGFVSGRNSGASGVFLFRESFEYEYIWDLGEY